VTLARTTCLASFPAFPHALQSAEVGSAESTEVALGTIWTGVVDHASLHQ
jgi:hypothetical protein